MRDRIHPDDIDALVRLMIDVCTATGVDPEKQVNVRFVTAISHRAYKIGRSRGAKETADLLGQELFNVKGGDA